MIYWLVQVDGADPHLARGRPPPGLLSAAEAEKFQRFTSEKRRRDWLLGRWTAKQLLRRVMEDEGRAPLPLHQIIIENNASGAPVVAGAPLAEGARYTLSLSHSHRHAFCAVVAWAPWPLGVDLERIGPRLERFAGDFFAPEEMALLHRAPPAMVDTLITAIWSAKEAALKALQLGLRVDTRAVICLLRPLTVVPEAWAPFAIAWDTQKLACPAPPLQGWWCVRDGFALALVSRRQKEGREKLCLMSISS